jgi:DNA-binding SARP family transcriptional activator/basic membrane lipoprotein Med (substrate-binding protein (PBP1-ABC) superfamily)
MHLLVGDSTSRPRVLGRPHVRLGESSNRLSNEESTWFPTRTSESARVHFRILGALEAEVGQDTVDLGGPKQRAVLAALLLRPGEVVPDARLTDEIWGDRPPASAAHGLEAYASKLRQALAPHGVPIERKGGGYRIDLGDARVDAEIFAALVDEAARASTVGDDTRAAALARQALELWSGPVLAGTTLNVDGLAEAERLEELRFRALELRIDADLALGRHGALVGELRQLVEANPYREHLVAQLMVALYRSGRQAEALEVYERTRRALDEDLGLRPSKDLQRLTGQILRQEDVLREPAPRESGREERPARRRRGVVAVALGGALAAATVALTLALTIPSDAQVNDGDATRVALIRMWPPSGVGDQETGWRPFVDGLLRAERQHDIETEIIDLFPSRPPEGGFEPGSEHDVERLAKRLRSGNFDLVLWPLGLTGPNFYDVVPLNAQSRFIFLDYCCVGDPALAGALNATALTLHADRAAHLAGYLSGLMEARRRLPEGRRHMVSTIVGEAGFPQERSWEVGFAAGARRALPDVEVRSDYSGNYENPKICERIANEQIDAGSGVVFAGASDCGLGALSAAAIRGVWGVAAGEDRSSLGSHILASATKRTDRLVELSVSWYLEGRLPAGEDVGLGLAEEAVGLVGISPNVPPDIRAKVAKEASRLRALEDVEKAGPS